MENQNKEFLCKVLSDAIGISINELRCVGFNGTGFIVDSGNIFSLKSIQKISEIKSTTPTRKIHIGEKKLDGSPDWRYKNHHWQNHSMEMYYFYFNDTLNNLHKVSLTKQRIDFFRCDVTTLLSNLQKLLAIISDPQSKNIYISIITEFEKEACLSDRVAHLSNTFISAVQLTLNR